MRVMVSKINTENANIFVGSSYRMKDPYQPVYGPFFITNPRDYTVGQELELKLCKVRGDGTATDIEVD